MESESGRYGGRGKRGTYMRSCYDYVRTASVAILRVRLPESESGVKLPAATTQIRANFEVLLFSVYSRPGNMAATRFLLDRYISSQP